MSQLSLGELEIIEVTRRVIWLRPEGGALMGLPLADWPDFARGLTALIA